MRSILGAETRAVRTNAENLRNMLIKWIVCNVPMEDRSSFSTAQERWKAISRAPGFVAQFGGWDEKNSQEACILSLWKDQASFDFFMAEIHDTVTESNSQASTYSGISVDFFEPEMEMPGEFKNLVDAIGHGNFLRVVDCRVFQERVEHFRQAQKDIWIPGMSQSPGMLGGSFNSGHRDPQRFLVTTLWSSRESHLI